ETSRRQRVVLSIGYQSLTTERTQVVVNRSAEVDSCFERGRKLVLSYRTNWLDLELLRPHSRDDAPALGILGGRDGADEQAAVGPNQHQSILPPNHPALE